MQGSTASPICPPEATEFMLWRARALPAVVRSLDRLIEQDPSLVKMRITTLIAEMDLGENANLILMQELVLHLTKERSHPFKMLDPRDIHYGTLVCVVDRVLAEQPRGRVHPRLLLLRLALETERVAFERWIKRVDPPQTKAA
jgi:hypothetical protein